MMGVETIEVDKNAMLKASSKQKSLESYGKL